jgi:hypothetical protein
MPEMKVAQVPKAGADFEMVERDIPQPPTGHVRIRVLACGVCHSDSFTKEGLFPGIAYPRVPGARDCRRDRRHWRRRDHLDEGRARRCRLARRARWYLPCVPPRRLRELPECASERHQLRRGLRRVHARTGRRRGAHARVARSHRSRAAHVCRRHDVQLAAPQRRASERPRRRSGGRRTRPPRHSVRAEAGLYGGGRGIAEARRRSRHPRHRAELEGDVGARRWPRNQTERCSSWAPERIRSRSRRPN